MDQFLDSWHSYRFRYCSVNNLGLCNQVEIRQIQVPDRLIGKTIEETEIRQKYRLNIIAIEDGDETDIEVMPDYRLCQGDIIVVIGKVDNIDVFANEI